MTKNISVLLLIIATIFAGCYTQKETQQISSENYAPRTNFRLMFYNLENLFDIYNDPLINDDEFTPDGGQYWNYRRYIAKLNNIAKTVLAVGQWSPPDFVGVCEIENRNVLIDLLKKTPLAGTDYRFFHHDSKDSRGIDVAFFYRKSKFIPIDTAAIPVIFPFNPEYHTRDIIYVKGLMIEQNDTVHIFINHWPSRYGGHMETEESRKTAALTVKHKTDSIFKSAPNANIVIIGDLNDYPTDASVCYHLKAFTDLNNPQPAQLYNLSYYLQQTKHLWSHKNQGIGGILDQIIVSGSLLRGDNDVITTKDDAHVADFDFLLEKSTSDPGLITNRTYLGFTYHGGFSDHLPVYLDIFSQNKTTDDN